MTAQRDRLDDVLDEMAHLLAEAGDELTRTVAASAVATLERLVGASLGPTEGDPVLLLARRYARAHRRVLAGAVLPPGGVALLRAHRDALRDPAAALLTACTTDPLQQAAESR